MLMEKETVEAFHMSGRVHDCGDKLGYLKAIVDYAMRDEQLGEEFEAFLKEIFKGANIKSYLINLLVYNYELYLRAFFNCLFNRYKKRHIMWRFLCLKC